jgi:ADP-ribosylglycohydrolase
MPIGRISSASTELATRLLGGVWGHPVGDAVGVPYEFGPAREASAVVFGASGAHGQPPGTWSDDGALMLALLDSLLQPGGFDPEDQGRRIVAWADGADYTPDGDGRFDIGNATSAAVARLKAGTPAEEAGGTEERSSGNGSLMRILPVTLVHHDASEADLVDMAHRASRVTHGTPQARIACSMYVLMAARLLAGERDRDAALRYAAEWHRTRVHRTEAVADRDVFL